ncbi:MAG TPA: bifunctional 4-hydroxy-2-oxoglutarate aldolase/2-dehydro-3-deoxy-phosphogluconate aldolase [Kofleriaceae bacterium]|nr:bifunctional 4-hydroxy-2-oxoglutarate aldolase/2-dehydro-3-deoxy-phosphogluconate aldolase [Kofleriaceae bacterium]
MSIVEFLAALWRERMTAIIRTDDQQRAASAMEAALRGGFRIIEFTLTIPGALELITDFSRRPDVLVGAGTVLTAAQAQAALRAGARFLVSPVTDEKIIAEARSWGAAAMPGAHTPTEMMTAHAAGAPLVKLFPAPAGGPTYVRSVLAPLPFLRIVPTNGVDAGNAAAYLEAGSFAVGMVKALFDPDDMAAGRLDAIEERARGLRRAVEKVARPDAPPEAPDPTRT